jgi:phage tail sheath protein FI
MTRLSYQAPGVYVEEVPSARQPIAGVGTNTVGFIGYIPGDRIWYPVPNPDYDPVTAGVMADFMQLKASTKDPVETETARLELQNRKSLLESDLKSTEEKREATNKKIGDLTTKPAPASTNAERAKAAQALNALNKEVTDLNEAVEAKKRDIQILENLITPPKAQSKTPVLGNPGEGSDLDKKNPPKKVEPEDKKKEDETASLPETEDVLYGDLAASDDLTKPSRLRPYYLKEFKLGVGEFETKLCTNFTQYAERFGAFSAFGLAPVNPKDPEGPRRFKPLHPGHHYLTHAVNGFFNNGGTRCFVAYVKSLAPDVLNKVLARFASIDDVAIIAAPGLPKTPAIWDALESYCEDDAHQNVFAILDPQGAMDEPKSVADTSESSQFDVTQLQHAGDRMPRQSNHAAFYFPWIEVVDGAKQLQDSDPARGVSPRYRGQTHVPPSGHIAGIYARTDEERGVHKAPANAIVRGAVGVKYYVSKPVQEMLNPQGVNCIRIMNGNITVWGARTCGGDMNGEWKYISVRRFAGFLEESIDQGTQWVVFEPNDTNLWSRIILNITAFLTNVWRSGALFGTTPQEAFYVKCDAELNPPEVRDLGMVITEIGVAIVRPAEFVIFRISQSTSQSKG